MTPTGGGPTSPQVSLHRPHVLRGRQWPENGHFAHTLTPVSSHWVFLRPHTQAFAQGLRTLARSARATAPRWGRLGGKKSKVRPRFPAIGPGCEPN